MRFIVTIAVLLCANAAAEAGVIRDRIKASIDNRPRLFAPRLRGTCAPCQGATNTSPTLGQPPRLATVSRPPVLNLGGSCPGGICPIR